VTRSRRLAGEALGSALLLVAVVGSGIMGDRLAGGNAGIALLANSIATGGALVALILTFGPISGSHFNPAVTLAFALRRELPWRDVAPYVAAQIAGAALGVVAAHAMFELPLIQHSAKLRPGFALLWSEAIATSGLLAVILSLARGRAGAAPYAVAAYITGAYWFTSSTSFANPAVTIARALTDTFAGIHPSNVPGFVLAQLAATVLTVIAFSWLTAEEAFPLRPDDLARPRGSRG
jgi:glycerol uptake facilitator-like aquaporin